MSSDLLVEDGGKVSLPEDVRERYGLTQGTPVRIIETRGGILLVPLTREPMSAELKRELDEWQSLSTSNIEMFPYDEEGER